MNCLITGGAGFIGSHLADELLARGHSVTVVDDLSTGRMENIEHLVDISRFEFIEDDASRIQTFARLDQIYHLAATVGVGRVIRDPSGTVENNVHGTERILENASLSGAKVFLASTSEVYGKSKSESFSEDDDLVFGTTTKPRWCYGLSKAIDEILALDSTVPVVIGRFFNVVGPRQVANYGMVVPKFIAQAIAGGPLTVHGDGTQVRSFAHVKDVVRAVIALMEHDGAVGQIYNIGSDAPVTIAELAKQVAHRVHRGLEIVNVPYSEAYGNDFEDVRHRVPDLTKLRNAISYEPEYDLDDILWETIGSYS